MRTGASGVDIVGFPVRTDDDDAAHRFTVQGEGDDSVGDQLGLNQTAGPVNVPYSARAMVMPARRSTCEAHEPLAASVVVITRTTDRGLENSRNPWMPW